MAQMPPESCGDCSRAKEIVEWAVKVRSGDAGKDVANIPDVVADRNLRLSGKEINPILHRKIAAKALERVALCPGQQAGRCGLN